MCLPIPVLEVIAEIALDIVPLLLGAPRQVQVARHIERHQVVVSRSYAAVPVPIIDGPVYVSVPRHHVHVQRQKSTVIDVVPVNAKHAIQHKTTTVTTVRQHYRHRKVRVH